MDICDLRAFATSAQSYIQDVKFPAGKRSLIEQAQKAGAPTGVMEVFNRIADRKYSSSLDLMKEIDNVVLISAYKKNITGGLDLPGSA